VTRSSVAVPIESSASFAASPAHDEPDAGAWLPLILLLSLALRAIDPLFNTPFEDESFMVLMGRSILEGASDVDIYMRTAFGWYLWPVSTALADHAAGLLGIRLLAAALGTVAVYGMFLLTRRLFDTRAALVAAALFGVCTPAILTSRLATHDAMSVPLLVFGVWAWVRALQRGTLADWGLAAVLLFASFLVKHPMAAFFPGLCLAAMALDRRGGFAFSVMLSLLVGGYALYYREVILALLQFVDSFAAFRAPDDQLAAIYLRDRLDFWLFALLALIAGVLGDRRVRIVVALLFLGAFTFIGVHVARRLDYHTWKHAVYALLFLAPAAGAAVVTLTTRVWRGSFLPVMLTGLVVAGGGYVAGRVGLQSVHGGLPFQWPDTRGVAEYLRPRVQPEHRVLVDDSAVRYQLRDLLAQDRIADQYWFEYEGVPAPASYGRAVQDGWFDYVVLDGTTSAEAKRIYESVTPHLAARYALRERLMQSVTGVDALIYERISPPVARPQGGPTILVEGPTAGSVTVAGGDRPVVLVRGVVRNAPPGATLLVEVQTNRWYPQGEPLRLDAADGRFEREAFLGGSGEQQCAHTIRLSLLGTAGRLLREVYIDRVARVAPDSVGLACNR
jgi:hypothetical protein